MNDPLDHATGVEKWELLKQKEGVDVRNKTYNYYLESTSTNLEFFRIPFT